MYSPLLLYLLRSPAIESSYEQPRQSDQSSQAATLSGFFHSFLWDVLGPSVSLYLRPLLCCSSCYRNNSHSGWPYSFSWGRRVLVWCDQFWLPGRPARHHQTKPCWQPSYWSLRSPVSSSPVTPDCQIISFRSHFSFHPLARMTPLSHPAQFLLASHFSSRVEVRFPIFKYREIGRTDITGVIIWKNYSTGES